jgi:hypothetical protein
MIDIDAALQGPRPRTEEIRDAVCRVFGYQPHEIENHGRMRSGNHAARRRIVACRTMIGMIGLRCGYSTREIAKPLGGNITLRPEAEVMEDIESNPLLQRYLIGALADIRRSVDARLAVAA